MTITKMKTAHIFALSTAIGALFTIVPKTYAAERSPLERRTKFIIYDNNNAEVFVSTSRDDVLEDALAECWPTKKYAMIVHGWRESCNTTWVVELRKNLITHRGGCILCMDYRDYDDDYGFLLINFKSIARILTDKLEVLRGLSFDSAQAFMFGFSFGARLIAKAAIDFGPKQIGSIHLCEMAGPGFDGAKNADPKMAAINSQCIHTASGGYGTRERICHQNWLMGNCGESQIGQRPFPFGNHGLCPVFYNHAFSHAFAAVDKVNACRQPINERDAINLPRDQIIQMGYFQNVANMSHLNEVNLYAVTSRDPPFN